MLLVSCCNKDGGIFAVDESTLSVTRLLREETRGIDVRGDLVYSAGRSSIRIHELVATNLGPGLREVERRISENDGRHGVRVYDKRVYIADAIGDAIEVVNDEDLEYRDSISIREDDRPGRCHTNDLFFEPDGSFVFTSFSDKPSVGYHDGNGCVKRYSNGGTIEVLKSNYLRPHSPVFKDGVLYFCDSGNERVVCGDYWQVKLPAAGFIRGLLITDKWIYVGMSKNRSIENSATCGVFRVDRNIHSSLIPSVFIPLPADEVYGIAECEEPVR